MSVYYPEGGSTGLAIRDLVRELLAKITELFSMQIELIKTEIKAGGTKMARTVVYAGGVLLFGSVSVLLLALSLIVALGKLLSFTWAVLATTGIFLGITSICGVMAAQEVKRNIDTIEVDTAD